MKKNKNIIIGSLLIVIAAIGTYGFLSIEETPPVEAHTIIVKKSDVSTIVTATGTIEPTNQVEVGTQVSGVVEKIYVDYNSIVKEGQLIAELDKTNLTASYKQAKAVYNNALTQKNYMQTIYNRQKMLYENQVISRADFEDAEYNLSTSKSTVVQRYADMQRAKTDLEYANIYSPIDGVVLSRAIDEGQTVAASYSTPTLFTIAEDLKEMQVEADVDEADIGYVKEGQRVTFTVDAYIGETFEGTVTQVRLDPTVESNVVTYVVVIKADNPNLKLKPGLTATISIYTLELKNVLTIEAKAVNFKPALETIQAYNTQHNLNKPPGRLSPNNDETVVWTYKPNGSIEPKPVKLGASDGVNVQVLNGLKEGDKLVYNLKQATSDKAPPAGDAESPFMPKPPGSNKKK